MTVECLKNLYCSVKSVIYKNIQEMIIASAVHGFSYPHNTTALNALKKMFRFIKETMPVKLLLTRGIYVETRVITKNYSFQ